MYPLLAQDIFAPATPDFRTPRDSRKTFRTGPTYNPPVSSSLVFFSSFFCFVIFPPFSAASLRWALHHSLVSAELIGVLPWAEFPQTVPLPPPPAASPSSVRLFHFS